MDPILCFPDPVPPELLDALDKAGYPWRGTTSAADVITADFGTRYSGAVICAIDEPSEALGLCRALRKTDPPVPPVLLVMRLENIGRIELNENLFDDICVVPCSTRELHFRLVRLFREAEKPRHPELIQHEALALNLETYQASIGGRPLNLTYMEYELLRFLASRPGRVFTREVLLSSVWGYEYFGGARTVDVHIRRLRAKFGEEHAHLIQTVRSVGYRFGRSEWSI